MWLRKIKIALWAMLCCMNAIYAAKSNFNGEFMLSLFSCFAFGACVYLCQEAIFSGLTLQCGNSAPGKAVEKAHSQCQCREGACKK